jgi:hypothetical protein
MGFPVVVLSQVYLPIDVDRAAWRDFIARLVKQNIRKISLYKNSDLRYTLFVPHPSGGALRIVT